MFVVVVVDMFDVGQEGVFVFEVFSVSVGGILELQEVRFGEVDVLVCQ